MSEDSTIAAIATAPGMGAVALLRISGPQAKSLAATVFRGRDPERWVPRRQHFGSLVDEAGHEVDEVLLTWFPAPHSFTGEEVVEIACHGGVVVTGRILDILLEAGAEPAGPGEFTQRAFLNGKLDLTQAEAVMDLISAQTELAAKAAREQLAGHLGSEVEAIRGGLISLTAHVEAYIDFPDEDIDPDSSGQLQERLRDLLDRIERLLATADQGRILREGLRTVIAGAPNAGKSSLLNLLLGFDRAIVNEQPGTTRDTIEEVVNLRGIPLRLVDTAGIREGEGAVEREGIERSRAQLRNAELVLLVIDSSEEAERVRSIDLGESARVIRLLNKSDLERHPDWEGAEGFPLSCLSGEDADALRDFLYERLVASGSVDTASLTSINSRHQRCLARAREELERARDNLAAGESPEFVSMDLRAALESIGDVIGKTDVEEILGEIFSTFCIGK